MSQIRAEDIKPLTALRAVAALWVILYTFWHNLDPSNTPALIAAGNLGVDLFFILSGFILCHVYGTELESKTYYHGRFLLHRLARIYPVHLTMILVVIALGLGAKAAGFEIDSNVLHWPSLPWHLALMQAWNTTEVAAFNHPSWSISAEWFAYLTFPAFAWVALKLRAKPVVALVLGTVACAGLYAAYGAVTGKPLSRATFEWGALRIVGPFFFGALLHSVHRSGLFASQSVSRGLTAMALIVLFVGIAYQAADGVLVAVLGFVVLGLARFDQDGAAPLLSAKPLVYLGEISFSAYMVYVPVQWLYLKGVAKVFGLTGALPFWVWILGLVAIWVAAAILHHGVEKPLRGWIRKRVDAAIPLKKAA